MELYQTLANCSEIYRKAMRILAAVLAFALASCSASNLNLTFDGQQALMLVERQLEFGPRIPGSDESKEAAAWIIEQLEGNGWDVEIQRFEHSGMALMNIIAKSKEMRGTKPILIGAHYDTRPLADQDPLYPQLPVPGANDGASGVAILLELARVLDQDRLQQPVRLVFFDAEDSGKLVGWDWSVGSAFFAENLSEDVEAVVIVDMVGDEDLQLHVEKFSDPDLVQEIWSVAASLGYSGFINTPKYSIIDDHLPFLQIGIPAIDIIDFDYPYYHTVDDTIDKVSAESLEQVGRTIEHWLEYQR